MLFKQISMFMKDGTSQPKDEFDYEDQAIAALEDLRAVENFFNNVSDPELLEYAAYEIEAAKRKYLYFMGKMRSIHPDYEMNWQPEQ